MSNKSSKHIISAIFFVIFLDMLGLGILIPIFPMLVATSSNFKIIPNSWTVNQGYIMLGWLMAVFPIFQFLFTPILGQFSDRFGRKKILIYSIIGTIFSYLLFAYGLSCKNLVLLFVARALDGISGANISTASAVIGDISNPEKRARNFGLIGISLGLGFILGPFLGGKLSDPHTIKWFNPTTPFYFAAFMSFLSLIIVISKLPETLQVKQNSRIDISKPFSNIKKAFLLPSISSAVIPIFLFNSGFAFFTAFFGVVLAEKYGFSVSQIGDFFAYTGIMMIMTQGLITRRLSGRVANHKVLRVSILITGISLVSYYFIPAKFIFLLYLIPPFLALGASLTRAFNQALLVDIAPETVRGEIMGINYSSLALSQILPSILAGYIAIGNTALPTLIGGIVTIIGGLIFIRNF